MIRRFIPLLMTFVLCWTTVACSSPNSNQSQQSPSKSVAVASKPISEGRYPVQQASYDDADGSYTLMLLNTPPGTSPIYRTANLQMARLTDEQIANGEKTFFEVKGDQAVMYLSEDFKIEYVHAVTETQADPQTGEQQTVVVRRESSFWTPFAGALAGQALGSLLFRPQYYVPPLYQPGGVIRGYGGYGSTYGRAVERYQVKHNAPPPAVKNRQTLRTTGNLRRTPSSSATSPRRPSSSATKSSGSGYGSNRLRNSGTSRPQVKRSPGFGSNSRVRTGSYGSKGGFRRRR